MKVTKIRIAGVGGLASIEIPFNDGMNILCGPNGIGKTTVIESIAHSFSLQQIRILKRNAKSEAGSIVTEVDVDGENISSNIAISGFHPGGSDQITGLYTHAKKLISLKVNRTFDYQPLASVSKDVDKELHSFYEEAKTGADIKEVKNWFVNRFMYSAHDGVLTDTQTSNFRLAKKSFSALDSAFSFSRVLPSSNEIMLSSPGGEIYYEYLSSGFKSCLSIIFGIIKDIEFRFKDDEVKKESIKAEEFDGVVLIDEIELHLHPEWQAKIATVLTQIFPKAQFVVSTHSPHVIQAAKPSEVIALEMRNGTVQRRPLARSDAGFQGWTVEEILLDVMGMRDVRSDLFNDLFAEFNLALDQDDAARAHSAYGRLVAILHPDNVMNKILKLQLGALAGEAAT